MDISVLNDNFLAQTVVDEYKSLVWTERYAAEGEVILQLPDTAESRLIIPEGSFLSIPPSHEIMIVETRSSKDGILTIKGTSLAGFLKHRILKRSWDNKYGFCAFAGTAPDILNLIVKNFAAPGYGGLMETGSVVDATNGPWEMIPNLSVATPQVQDPSKFTVVNIPVQHGNVYDGLVAVATSFGLGFSMYPRNVTETSYNLIFQAYDGRDLTSRQSLNPVVRFQSALDNLTNVEELRSIANFKTVAWSYAPNVLSTSPYFGYWADDWSKDFRVAGFKRRTLLVLADDIQPGDVDLTTTAGQNAFRTLLNQRAMDGLANNNYVRMLDGEIVPQSGYRYGIEYNLGDVIELSSPTGGASYARITEYIYSQDENGYSSYPTLSVIS